MATSPKLPAVSSRRPINKPAHVQPIRQSKFSWPIAALIVGVSLLIAGFALRQMAKHVSGSLTATQNSAQPTADQVQFTNLKIVYGPAKDSLYLTGLLHNTGDSEIGGVQVQADFLGRNGPVLGSITRPVEGLAKGGNSSDLKLSPIRPDESRPVRIYFEHVPRGWNHQLPELTVIAVSGTKP